MEIVDFIKSNIILVIAVVAFLYKLLSGFKTQKGNAMPTFGGDAHQNSREEDVREYNNEIEYERNYEQQQRRLVMQQQQEEQMYAEQQQMRELQMRQEQQLRYEQQQRAEQAATIRQSRQVQPRSEARGNQYQSTEASSIYNSEIAAVGHHNLFENKALSGEELRKAVLWSEVLSAPRAKRPFRR